MNIRLSTIPKILNVLCCIHMEDRHHSRKLGIPPREAWRAQVCMFEQTQPQRKLTQRETEVLEWIGRGNTSRQIAGSLGISIHTVNNHRKRICRKLRVHSTAELVSLAARQYLAPAPAPLAAAQAEPLVRTAGGGLQSIA